MFTVQSNTDFAGVSDIAISATGPRTGDLRAASGPAASSPTPPQNWDKVLTADRWFRHGLSGP